MGPSTDDLSLVASGVTKSFDGNIALNDFAIHLRPGEVHALVGHNGSGKSTFIKVLAGFHTPDRGEVRVNSRDLAFGDPTSSLAVGLSFVHQTLGLAPALSVFENLHLGKPYDVNAFGMIRSKREYKRAKQTLEQWGLTVDPHIEVARLSAVERVEVALARALGTEETVSVLVLDEPTAALGQTEVDRLFAAIHRITAAGVSVIYVSHRLDELPLIADTATVLRDGQIVAGGPIAEFDIPRLVRLISGSVDEDPDRGTHVAPRSAAAGTPQVLMRIEDLRGEILDGVGLEANGGEILGVFGLAGSGVEELVDVLTGRSVARSGTLSVDGRQAHLGDVAGLSRHGLRIIAGDKADRVIGGLTLAENATQAVIGRYFRRGFLSLRGLAGRAREVLRVFDVNPPMPNLLARSLSGGNQQKLALARVVQGQPSVLVLERPFEGVDVGARRELASLLRSECDQGRAVILVDNSADELMGVCDTIMVLHNGAVALQASGPSMKKSLIVAASYGTAR